MRWQQWPAGDLPSLHARSRNGGNGGALNGPEGSSWVSSRYAMWGRVVTLAVALRAILQGCRWYVKVDTLLIGVDPLLLKKTKRRS